MLILINPSAAFMKTLMTVVTAATAVSIVAATITIGVFAAKENGPFSVSMVVLQSPATIVLNRFIEPYELPLFYDAVATMDIFLADIKNVLTEGFKDKFITAQWKSFTSTPNVTSTQEKEFTLRKRFLSEKQSGGNDASAESTTSTPLTTYETTDYPTTTTSFDTCTDALIKIKNYRDDHNNRSCVNIKVPLKNCTNTTNAPGMIDCLNIKELVFNCKNDTAVQNITVLVQNCSYISNHTIDCNNITIELTDCFNRSTSVHNTSTWSTTTSTILSTTTSIDNTTRCNISLNTAGQTSIIFSTMILFFKVKPGESISAEEIFNTLKSLQPNITLLTGCLQPSSQISSFNATLSNVQTPSKSDLTVGDLQNQPSISASLEDQVLTDAKKAEDEIVNNLTTQPSVTSQIAG
jgi:hypothetical protein